MGRESLQRYLKSRAADTADTPDTPDTSRVDGPREDSPTGPAQAAGAAGSAVTPPAAATDPNAWRVLSAAYHAHHFACHVCIAAGRGAQYGLRCGVGAALWVAYQESP